MAHKNDTKILIIALLLTAGLLTAFFTLLKGDIFPVPPKPSVSTPPENLKSTKSLGQAILITADVTADKREGVEAFLRKDFADAVQHFQVSLRANSNDPETLIYLNNAKAAKINPVTIAVVAPIGGNLNVAKEILRGVAQVQNEINQKGGIDGRLLQVLIVNDSNKPDVAQQEADSLVKDSSILAVVGHNSSDATLAAAPIYEQGQLVMISPTAKANKIAQLGDYIFRTVFPTRLEADVLARYIVKTAKKTNTLICYDSQDENSKSFKEDITVAVAIEGGKLAAVDCDFSAADFNPDALISQGISNGADSLLLNPSVNRLTAAFEIAKANQKKLSLFGTSTLYTFQTLKEGQGDVKEMVLTVPWHPDAFVNNYFPKQAKKLWGGTVNWRTANAYDATEAIIAGLKKGVFSRQGLQQTLSQPGFATEGASGKVEFLPSGDRVGTPILVKIKPDAKAEAGFTFVPIKP